MARYPTPHINASPEDFAHSVLMPGDPQRSRFIAENYFTAPRLVNDVRGVQGYTGLYKGVPVSVMASGMGMPSIGIYSYELYNFFGVENIIRVGSAGAMSRDIKIKDIILAVSASTDSSFAAQFDLPGILAPCADFGLLSKASALCVSEGIRFRAGNILSTDVFYNSDPGSTERWASMGILCVEMETAALYMNAAKAGKKALSILTVSDHMITGETTTAEQRRSSFTEMIHIALETSVSL